MPLQPVPNGQEKMADETRCLDGCWPRPPPPSQRGSGSATVSERHMGHVSSVSTEIHYTVASKCFHVNGLIFRLVCFRNGEHFYRLHYALLSNYLSCFIEQCRKLSPCQCKLTIDQLMVSLHATPACWK